jgi:hypothetical protein
LCIRFYMNLCIDSKYVSDFQCKYHKNGVYQWINELVYQRVYESVYLLELCIRLLVNVSLE